jgi:hypothetical protein
MPSFTCSIASCWMSIAYTFLGGFFLHIANGIIPQPVPKSQTKSLGL